MPGFRLSLRDRPRPYSVETWRDAARKVLPDLAWNYVEGVADDGVSFRENIDSFLRWRLRQRVLTGVTSPDLETVMAGTKVSMPLALAPTALSGLSNWRGDIAMARGAEKLGTRLLLSTGGSYSLEEVADATEEDHWLQIYPFGNRERVGSLVRRAKERGYSAIFLTVDVPVVGNRESGGTSESRLLTPGRLAHYASHFGWVRDALFKRRLGSPHLLEPDPGGDGSTFDSRLSELMVGPSAAEKSADSLSRFMQSNLSWEDLAWLRDLWGGPLYVKGVLSADDAARCVDEFGVQGVVVSNHGGRQLDRGIPPLSALPSVVARIGDRAEVYLDGGIRRGTDVITALCLGARAVFIGRPYLYGLAAAGQQGVESILALFREEISRAMRLMGCPGIRDLDLNWIAASEPALPVVHT